MKRLLTILLVICSVSVFGQKRPAPTPAPTSLTTFTFSVNADSSLNAYSGSTWLWWQILSKYQADKLYQPLGSPVATPFSLSAGYGLSGSSFNGSVARTFTADTASADGLVSKSRLATNLGGYVPSSRTITINGSTRDLSANRIFNVGSVTSVTPAYGLTPQTAITSSGTFRVDTTVIQTVLNFFPKGDTRYQRASVAPTSISATSPIFYNSGTGVISSQAASGTLSGYVTAGTQTFGGNKTFNGSISGTSSIWSDLMQITRGDANSLLVSNTSATHAPIISSNTGAGYLHGFFNSSGGVSYINNSGLLEKIGGTDAQFLRANGTVLGSTGSGDVVRATSPTLVTPNIGAATGTSLTTTGNLTAPVLVSTVATGTAPFTVASTTPVANLSIGGTAASVTTNANLTGPITSVGNATSVGSQTGTGNTFVMNTSPTLITPIIGAATGTSLTTSGNLTAPVIVSNVATGTAPFTVASTTPVANLSIGGNAASVTTNANLTGPITSVGNATSIGSQTGTGNTFVMETSPTLITPNIGVATGTSLAATSSLTGETLVSTVATGTAPFTVASTTPVANLSIGGNAATATLATTATTATNVTTNANLTGPITSVGNATSVGAQTGTGNTFVMNTSPTLITPVIGVATGTSLTTTGNLTAPVIVSNVAIGTAPFTVTSTTPVTNLSIGGNAATATLATTATNVTTNANLTGPITSVGNATSVASQTGTGSTFVMNTSPTLVTPNIGAATGTSVGLTGNITVAGSIFGGNIYANENTASVFVGNGGTGASTVTMYREGTVDAYSAYNSAGNVAKWQTGIFGANDSYRIRNQSSGTVDAVLIDASNNLSVVGSISSTPQGTLYGTASGSITSAQLATSLTDETGTGSAVFNSSPSITTPTFTTSATVGAGTSNINFGATSNYGYASFNGSASLTGMLGMFGGGSGDLTSLYLQAPTGGSLDFRIGSTDAFHVNASGDLIISGSNATKASGTAWINPSDLRLKMNVGDYSKGLAEVLQIKPKTWYFNKASGFDQTKKHLSPIAQELKLIMPEMVSTYKGKLNGKEQELLQVDASDMTWLLVKAIQEQQAIIEKLNQRITLLEQK